jgi:hypothetical protein
MASLYISEYEQMPHTSGSKIQAALEPRLAAQKLTIAGASAASSAFHARTRFVRLHTDAICSFIFGLTPVATADEARLPAGATEYFGVEPGINMKVAVITNS